MDDFLRLNSQQQYSFKIKMSQFYEPKQQKLPYMFRGDDLVKYEPSDPNMKQGYWQKLLLNGSGQPIARENSTLMPTLENG